jgi:hypothetical protein
LQGSDGLHWIEPLRKRDARLSWIDSFSVGDRMKRFTEGEDPTQVAPFAESLNGFVAEDNPSRIVEAVVEQLDLGS